MLIQKYTDAKYEKDSKYLLKQEYKINKCQIEADFLKVSLIWTFKF